MKNILLALLIPLGLSAQKNPVELGHVHWLRSMDEAKAKAKAENKPILILFQEIPGCATCRNYGTDVLTMPLIVEAIETHFIPLAIYNNKDGADAAVLKQYNEPAWNNPVVRAVDLYGKDVAVRLSGNYSAAGLAAWMTQVLIKNKGRAPQYLQLLADELQAKQRTPSKLTYSMYCFWTGEALFGKLNGVVKTTAAHQGGKEVVVVEYDPNIISAAKLNEVAQSNRCATATNGDFKPDSTPKYYLSKSKYRDIDMLEIQKCRVNAALGEGLDPAQYLSPRQINKIKT
jgi:hypothetical protein